jgi:hypothetical protein
LLAAVILTAFVIPEKDNKKPGCLFQAVFNIPFFIDFIFISTGIIYPVTLVLFCSYPHIFQHVTRPDSMGEHPPNSSILSPPR